MGTISHRAQAQHKGAPSGALFNGADMKQSLDVLDDDHLVIKTYADLDEMDRVTRECERIREATKSTGDVTMVASVPQELVVRFCDLKGITFADFMRRGEFDREFLNSEEVKAFRTWQGRL